MKKKKLGPATFFLLFERRARLFHFDLLSVDEINVHQDDENYI